MPDVGNSHFGFSSGVGPQLQESECRRVAILWIRLYDLTPVNSDEQRNHVRNGLFNACQLLLDQVKVYGGVPGKLEFSDEAGTGFFVSCVFGSQTARENDAERSVRAALDLLDKVQTLNRDFNSQNLHLQLQMGVHYAQVTTQQDGQLEFQNNALAMARGLALAAPSDHLLVSSEVKAILADLCHYEGMGTIYLQGQVNPLPAYRVVGLNARVEGRWQRSRLLRRSALVGREQTLKFLQELYARSCSPEHWRRTEVPAGSDAPSYVRPTIVSLSGPEGYGKSRILYEFRRLTPPFKDGMMSPLVGRAASIFPVPYAIFTELLRNLFNIRLTDPDHVRARKLESGLPTFAAHEPAVEQSIHIFNYLLGGVPEHSGHDDARAFQHELRVAFSRLLRGVARHTFRSRGVPLLVYLEDLQGIHERSQAALMTVLERLKLDVPLLIFMTYRSGFRLAEGLANAADLHEVNLEPLPPEALRQLIANMLDGAELPSILESRLLEKAGGNPFFLEELIRSLVEERVLHHVGGKWVLARPADDVHLPASLSALLMSRLDTLERPVRELLLRASVEGEVVHMGVLEEIQKALEGPAPGPLMRQLEDARLVRMMDSGDDPVYLFENPMVREVSYQTLVPHNRQILHGLVARAMELRFSGSLSDHYLALAHHFRQAGENSRAADYYRLAGEKAQAEYANELAVSSFTTYLNLAGEVSQARRVRWRMARVLRYMGRADEAGAVLEALSREILPDLEGTSVFLAEVLLELARVRRTIGQPREGVALARSALSYFVTENDLTGQAEAYVAMGKCLRLLGDIPGAEKHLFNALSLLELAGEGAAAGQVYSNLGRLALDRRQFEVAQDYFERALKYQEASQDRWGIALELGHLGEVSFIAGDLEAADAFLDRCLHQAEALDIRQLVAGTRMYLGAIRARRGDSSGLALIDDGIRIASALQDLPRKVRGHQLRAEALESLQRRSEAQQEKAIMRAAARDAGMLLTDTAN